MSRVLPILFNSEMVRAILRETNPKTATRRAIKGFIPDDAIWGYTIFTPKGYISCRGTFADGYGEKFFRLPCQPGNLLYVRETWCRWYLPHGEWRYEYRATSPNGNKRPTGREYDDKWETRPWCPSIHMPKEVARIWLKVTSVRVERLHKIEIEDALAEGITPEDRDRGCSCRWAVDGCLERPCANRDAYNYERYINPFMKLWDSTIKKSDLDRYGWYENPWVWVIEFERCEKPESEG